jgi:hypothetical protein
METIALTIAAGDWHFSRIRVIGCVVDSIAQHRNKTITIAFYNEMLKMQIYSYQK